jgi:bifunctional diaminopimelate decarboxylase / aspartate kinase
MPSSKPFRDVSGPHGIAISIEPTIVADPGAWPRAAAGLRARLEEGAGRLLLVLPPGEGNRAETAPRAETGAREVAGAQEAAGAQAGARKAADRFLQHLSKEGLSWHLPSPEPGAPASGAGVGTRSGKLDGLTVVLADPAGAAAARRGAERLEIWSHAPGLFSADPEEIPTARLLRRLSWAEAQEIGAAAGFTRSGIPHPRTMRAARLEGIPVRLRGIDALDGPGTDIGPADPDGSAALKAIVWRKGVIAVSLEALEMWQEVGFLARVFEVFRDAGLSVDLVSTSETNVTVTLDPGWGVPGAEAGFDRPRLDEAIERLSALSRVTVVRPCAAVSLVGRRIRSLLHRLAPALEEFEEHRIHLLSQAASDINFTLVVDEEEADRLVRQLHRTLVAEPGSPEVFGPTWQELVLGASPPPPPAAWWRAERDSLLERFSDVDAAYAYHLDTVRRQVRELRELTPVSRVLYAMKANPHPDILRTAREEGAGIECVSRGEVEAALDLLPDLPPDEVLFTPNFAPRSEYAFAFERGVRVTLDALHPLVHWPELFRGRRLFLRLDPGEGAGHHEKVTTAGLRSKFGIHRSELDELSERLRAVEAEVVGLHVHAGSGISGPGHWARMGRFLVDVAERWFPGTRVLDLGGGLPVPHRPGEPALDVGVLAEGLAEVRAKAPPGTEIWLEPGRYLVGEAGVLLTRVTQTKQKGPVRYVGVATGMNSLIRPSLYGAYHEIVNLTRLDEPTTERVQVVGPICETGDRLGMDRLLPPTREGDLLLVATCGAYGRAMASSYNLRKPADEFVV